MPVDACLLLEQLADLEVFVDFRAVVRHVFEAFEVLSERKQYFITLITHIIVNRNTIRKLEEETLNSVINDDNVSEVSVFFEYFEILDIEVVLHGVQAVAHRKYVMEILLLLLHNFLKSLGVGGGAAGVENKFEVFGQFFEHLKQVRSKVTIRFHLTAEPSALNKDGRVDGGQFAFVYYCVD